MTSGEAWEKMSPGPTWLSVALHRGTAESTRNSKSVHGMLPAS